MYFAAGDIISDFYEVREQVKFATCMLENNLCIRNNDYTILWLTSNGYLQVIKMSDVGFLVTFKVHFGTSPCLLYFWVIYLFVKSLKKKKRSVNNSYLVMQSYIPFM